MHEYKNLPEGMALALGILVIIGLLVGVVIYCLYIKNLQDTLRAVRPQNRQMPPGQVWLLLLAFLNIFASIPAIIIASGDATGFNPEQNRALLAAGNGLQKITSLFILVWHYRIVQKISESIAMEYASRNLAVEAKPTFQVGMLYCISLLASIGLSFMPQLGILSSVVTIGYSVLWIMYWAKTAEYKKAMRALPANPDEGESLFDNLY